MAVTYGFYDSVSGDRVYSANDFNKMMRGIIMDGVFADYGNALYVVEDTAMDIIVQTGKCWFDDTWTENGSDLTLTVTAAHATLNRKDAVVVEIDKTSGVRTNSIKIIAGTAAASPVLPTLETGPTIFQYMLAEIFVGAAVTSITDANITNRVGQEGYVDYVSFLTDTPVINKLQQCIDINMLKNYPTIERATASVPMWWIQYGTTTFTEINALAGGAPANAPIDRVFKNVAGASGTGWQQTLYVNDSSERWITANLTYLSFSSWVHTSAGTVTFRLRDNGGTNLGTVSSTQVGAWEHLKIEGVQALSNAILVQMYTDTNGSTTYTGGMMLNPGPISLPFRPRGSQYRLSQGTLYSTADPGGSPAGWQLLDVTSLCGAGCHLADLQFFYSNNTTAGTYIRTRTYGTTVGAANDVVFAPATGTIPYVSRKMQLVDDQQRFEFYSSAAAGDTESLTIYTNGWYEWE